MKGILLFSAGAFLAAHLASSLFAQTLTLSSATTPSQTASLNLSLNSGSGGIAALQWTLQYPQAAFTSVSATPGPALTGAGKSLSCATGAGSYTCIAYGLNATAVPDGVLAIVSVSAVNSGAIMISNQVAASPAGTVVPLTTTGGTVTLSTPTLTSVTCSPAVLVGATSSNCTVSLSSSAAAATAIAITSNNTSVVVPASVTVAAGAATAQFFTVSGGGANSTATITATLNGVSATSALTLTTTTFSMHVNAGGGAYTDSQGLTWATDANYSGGRTWSAPNPIWNTTSLAVYQTCRWGAFTYTLPVPNGSYNVILKFAEISRFGRGVRQFNVAINGDPVLTNFDIFAKAGGAFIALDQIFPVTISNGQVVIQFSNGRADSPLVNAIDIEPPGYVPPPVTTSEVRINAGGPAFTDPAGILWAADTGFTSGTTWSVTNAITNTTTPTLYQTCRWGAFSYSFNVPNGRHNVVLKFAEVTRFAPGLRQFNVAINGTAVLTNFDIFAEAGGGLRALDRTFPVTVTNGQIVVQFSPGAADLPLISAIAIDPVP